MGNLFLILTIVSETVAVVCMKLSNGFEAKFYTACAIISYGLSFVFLTLALKYLPAGIANAIWAGASTILVTLLGMLIFKEALTTIQVISMLLITIGLVGLNFDNAAG